MNLGCDPINFILTRDEAYDKQTLHFYHRLSMFCEHTTHCPTHIIHSLISSIAVTIFYPPHIDHIILFQVPSCLFSIYCINLDEPSLSSQNTVRMITYVFSFSLARLYHSPHYCFLFNGTKTWLLISLFSIQAYH